MQRVALAIIAVLLLVAGVALYFSNAGLGWTEFLGSVLIKVGIVLSLYWLAYDQVMHMLSRSPPWMIGMVLLAVGILVIRPKSLIFIAPVLAMMAAMQFVSWLFKPLPTKKPAKPNSEKSTEKPVD